MPLSLTSIFIGFVIGVAATAMAWSLTQKTVRNPETFKVTGVWNIKDVAEPGTHPAVIAERIDGMDLPPQSKLLVPASLLDALPTRILETCEVRMHPDVRINAAVGRERALLFTGAIGPRSHAVVTRDTNTVRRLQDDFKTMWTQATPYVERVPTVSALKGKTGRIVQVPGRATEVMEYRGRKMIRITDGKAQVGVITDQQNVAQYQGRDIRITGRMKREGTHPFIEADHVEPLHTDPMKAPAVPA